MHQIRKELLEVSLAKSYLAEKERATTKFNEHLSNQSRCIREAFSESDARRRPAESSGCSRQRREAAARNLKADHAALTTQLVLPKFPGNKETKQKEKATVKCEHTCTCTNDARKASPRNAPRPMPQHSAKNATNSKKEQSKLAAQKKTDRLHDGSCKNIEIRREASKNAKPSSCQQGVVQIAADAPGAEEYRVIIPRSPSASKCEQPRCSGEVASKPVVKPEAFDYLNDHATPQDNALALKAVANQNSVLPDVDCNIAPIENDIGQSSDSEHAYRVVSVSEPKPMHTTAHHTETSVVQVAKACQTGMEATGIESPASRTVISLLRKIATREREFDTRQSQAVKAQQQRPQSSNAGTQSEGTTGVEDRSTQFSFGTVSRATWTEGRTSVGGTVDGQVSSVGATSRARKVAAAATIGGSIEYDCSSCSESKDDIVEKAEKNEVPDTIALEFRARATPSNSQGMEKRETSETTVRTGETSTSRRCDAAVKEASRVGSNDGTDDGNADDDAYSCHFEPDEDQSAVLDTTDQSRSVSSGEGSSTGNRRSMPVGRRPIQEVVEAGNGDGGEAPKNSAAPAEGSGEEQRSDSYTSLSSGGSFDDTAASPPPPPPEVEAGSDSCEALNDSVAPAGSGEEHRSSDSYTSMSSSPGGSFDGTASPPPPPPHQEVESENDDDGEEAFERRSDDSCKSLSPGGSLGGEVAPPPPRPGVDAENDDDAEAFDSVASSAGSGEEERRSDDSSRRSSSPGRKASPPPAHPEVDAEAFDSVASVGSGEEQRSDSSRSSSPGGSESSDGNSSSPSPPPPPPHPSSPPPVAHADDASIATDDEHKSDYNDSPEVAPEIREKDRTAAHDACPLSPASSYGMSDASSTLLFPADAVVRSRLIRGRPLLAVPKKRWSPS